MINLFTPINIEEQSKNKSSQKQVIGVLTSYDKETISLELIQPIKKVIEIPRKNISNIKLRYNWEEKTT